MIHRLLNTHCIIEYSATYILFAKLKRTGRFTRPCFHILSRGLELGNTLTLHYLLSVVPSGLHRDDLVSMGNSVMALHQSRSANDIKYHNLEVT